MNIKYPIEQTHTKPWQEIVNDIQTDSHLGLTQAEAEKRINAFGENIYQAQKQKSIGKILLEQFTSPIVYMLIVGAGISFYFRDYMEAIAILVVILINALIGFLMELQARSSMNALRQMEVTNSKVIRDGILKEIPSEKLTPGDLILLEAGDVVPGDGRVIESNHLQCDESSLTGESLPVEKNINPLPPEATIADQHNMVFKGTAVMNGSGKAVITGIAAHTQLGTITSLVENSTETATPLDKKLQSLSKKLIVVTLIMTAFFAVSGFIEGKKWDLILKTSIALAVAAIPEGLPIVATVALAYGMLLMARRNAIVKKLSSVETLGSTNVILTDKTGTLTENKIHVERFAFPGEEKKVRIETNQLIFENGPPNKNPENFEKIKFIGALCNDVTINQEKNEKKISGDPIEIALMRLTNASGVSFEELRIQFERIAEAPFNSDTKIMGTLHHSGTNQFVAAKGSVEHLLEKCQKFQFNTSIREISEEDKKNIIAESEKLAAEGLRVLAFAYKEGSQLNNDDFLHELIYVGMIGFLDPPRLDIKDTILTCRKAGIKIVMITGDHPMTALTIARKTGLVDDETQDVINGKDLPEADQMPEDWKQKILNTSIFARTTPKQKLDIADFYQQAGNIVAMTGDGVNDAPALKKADVGIAMGQRGTAVAKETASIVLKDDSFVSITEAIAHGREIFQNIQKFVIYLVSCNLSEILIVSLLGFFTHYATLLPLQILFLNMVTDIFPALALGVGKGDETVMQHSPRDPKKELITNQKWMIIALYAFLMTMSVIGAVLYCKELIDDNDMLLNNVAFITLTFTQLFHVFNMSSMHSGFFVNDITKNKFIWLAFLTCTGLLLLVFLIPGLRTVLNLSVLSAQVWTVSVVASLLPLIMVQAYKLCCMWKRRNHTGVKD
ncbi:MAG TPA: cation-translocating P-type ATPase [Cytophagaceae bacterium]|nr:cation-translocating P-type ATPase [Cytophagaceae bacterium]